MRAAPPTSTTTRTAARRPSSTVGSVARSRTARSRRRAIGGTVTTAGSGVVPRTAEAGLLLAGEGRTTRAADDAAASGTEDAGMALALDVRPASDAAPRPTRRRLPRSALVP